MIVKARVFSPALGNYKSESTFTYKNGKFVISKTAKITYIAGYGKKKKLKTSRGMYLYKKPEKKGKVYIKKGTRLRPNAVQVAGNKVWYRVKYKKKQYWIKGTTNKSFYKYSDKHPSKKEGAINTPVFQNVVMAG